MSNQAVPEIDAMFKRFAVYVTLPDGPLSEFGAAWLGWDLATGRAVTHPDLGFDIAPITRTPRKYGFHGTIKPPFALAPGTDPGTLSQAVAAFCAAQPAVTLRGLRLARIGGFLALVAEGDQAPLAQLAARAVRGLDRFRARPTQAELDRRRNGLTPAQERNLALWGYPHVMDCFRFHITLTGQLPEADAARVRAALAPQITPLLPHPFTINRLTLCGEDETGNFHALHHYALTG